ncbi:hypothetical protein DUI87_34332 [Hirundo rustica rustica]|uniref:MHC class I-like antigen recognition-like domain-containing protein n=1 Tax=Hirundo rustica rustica TaxID=333673 RepID=A0A3M0ILN6_HIRRU|nr:hypothetical protein DUI87_34332 [Hirundo rustica rustica]
MLPGLGGFVLGSVCLGWGSASPAGEGLHTLQEVSGCHLLSHGSVHGSLRLGSDRREFLSFQLGSKRFVVATSAGQITKRRWEHEEMEAEE